MKEAFMTTRNRRQLLEVAGVTLAGAVSFSAVPASGADEAKKVGAVEDLMREHGILRRCLLVYGEAASRFVRDPSKVPLQELGEAARLFRDFGENYHERQLEEAFVFPAVQRGGGDAALLARVLKEQHERGRLITGYVREMISSGSMAAANAAALSAALASFVHMYQYHAAVEDTVVFPAWKAAVSDSEYAELSERFEDIEHRLFGRDGFEDALARIEAVEKAFGIENLGNWTAATPPRSGP
jgi:hemerythrin-like domain-containing protein